MRLAERLGLQVAPVRLVRVAGKDVLLVERFDRMPVASGWRRRAMVSALTLFGLDELMARYASYADLAEIIRHRFTQPIRTTLAPACSGRSSPHVCVRLSPWRFSIVIFSFEPMVVLRARLSEFQRRGRLLLQAFTGRW